MSIRGMYKFVQALFHSDNCCIITRALQSTYPYNKLDTIVTSTRSLVYVCVVNRHAHIMPPQNTEFKLCETLLSARLHARWSTNRMAWMWKTGIFLWRPTDNDWLISMITKPYSVNVTCIRLLKLQKCLHATKWQNTAKRKWTFRYWVCFKDIEVLAENKMMGET